MPFCHFLHFDFSNLFLTFAKENTGAETSKLEIKFYSKVVFIIDTFNIIAILYYV